MIKPVFPYIDIIFLLVYETHNLSKNDHNARYTNIQIKNFPLRKLAHAIYKVFLSRKIETFQKNFVFAIFLIFAQNIDCW